MEEVGVVTLYIIFLTSNGKKYCPLLWNSNKVKRVVRPTLAAEALVLNEVCESGIYNSKIFKQLLKTEQIPLLAMTGNKSTNEITSCNKR